MPPAPAHSDDVLVWVIVVLAGLVFLCMAGLVVVLKRKPEKTSIHPEHKTFADDPDLYWERMRQVVTEPLSRILEKQTEVQQDLIKEIVRIDERSKLRSGKTDE